MMLFIVVALFLVGPAIQTAAYAHMERSNHAELACALATIPFNIAARGYDAQDKKGKAAVMRMIANGFSLANKALFFHNQKKILGTIVPESDTVINGALALRDVSKILQDLYPYARSYLKFKPSVSEDDDHFLDFQYHATTDIVSDDDVFFDSDSNESATSVDDIFSLDVDDEKPEKEKPSISKPSISSISSLDDDMFVMLDDSVYPINPEDYQSFNPITWLKANAPFLLKNSSFPILKGLSAAAVAMLQQYELFGKYRLARMAAVQAQSLGYLLEEYVSYSSNRYLSKMIAVAIAVNIGSLVLDLSKLYFHMKELAEFKTIECDVFCYEDRNSKDFVYLPCGHPVTCVVCFKEKLDDLNKDYNNTGCLTCSAKDCRYVLSQRDLKLLYKDDKDQAAFFKLLGQFAKRQGGEQCPTEGCTHVVMNKKGAGGEYTCPECKHHYCKACYKVHPSGIHCALVGHEENMTPQQRVDIMNAYAQEEHKDKRIRYRVSPCCQQVTAKGLGCNHMTCPKCNANWCWLCGQQYWGNHFTPLLHPQYGDEQGRSYTNAAGFFDT